MSAKLDSEPISGLERPLSPDKSKRNENEENVIFNRAAKDVVEEEHARVVAEIPITSSHLLKQLSLEEENNYLRNSLLKLTSHIGQIQFRVKQLCDNAEKNRLSWSQVKDLEKFAFSSCVGDKEDMVRTTVTPVPSVVFHSSKNDKSSIQHLRNIPGRRMSLDLPRKTCEKLHPVQEEILIYLRTQLKLLEKYDLKEMCKVKKKASALEMKGPSDDVAAFLTSQIELNGKQLVLLQKLKKQVNVRTPDESPLSHQEMKKYVKESLTLGTQPDSKKALASQIKGQIANLRKALYYIEGMFVFFKLFLLTYEHY